MRGWPESTARAASPSTLSAAMAADASGGAAVTNGKIASAAAPSPAERAERDLEGSRRSLRMGEHADEHRHDRGSMLREAGRLTVSPLDEPVREDVLDVTLEGAETSSGSRICRGVTANVRVGVLPEGLTVLDQMVTHRRQGPSRDVPARRDDRSDPGTSSRDSVVPSFAINCVTASAVAPASAIASSCSMSSFPPLERRRTGRH